MWNGNLNSVKYHEKPPTQWKLFLVQVMSKNVICWINLSTIAVPDLAVDEKEGET